MNEAKYEVFLYGALVASHMALNDALLLTRALMEKYFNEIEIVVAIERMRPTEGRCENYVGKMEGEE